MVDLQSMLVGAGVVIVVRELVDFFTPLFCERVIAWRCRKLPIKDRDEAIESMIADMKTQRSVIGMIAVAFSITWYRWKAPELPNDDAQKEEQKETKDD